MNNKQYVIKIQLYGERQINWEGDKTAVIDIHVKREKVYVGNIELLLPYNNTRSRYEGRYYDCYGSK